jgi:hypothetical protein
MMNLSDDARITLAHALDQLTEDAACLAIDGKLVQARVQLSKALRRIDEVMVR